ncbi:hypothetical protein BGZ92_005150 [Podila epicladia]|nr:hypothetical protein BGZ92_005150 [Podila epicladia]
MSEVLEDVQQPFNDYSQLAVKAKAMYQLIRTLHKWTNTAKHRLLEDAPSSATSEIPMSEVEQLNSPDVSDHEAAGSIPNARLHENENKDKYNM